MDESLRERLKPYLEGDLERVGVVRRDGSIVELRNVLDNKVEGFDLNGEDLLELEKPETVATWHTHPSRSCNLSILDRENFLNWPELRHIIVGINGVAVYAVENGEVVIVA